MWEYKVVSNVNIGNFVFVKTPIVKLSNLTGMILTSSLMHCTDS